MQIVHTAAPDTDDKAKGNEVVIRLKRKWIDIAEAAVAAVILFALFYLPAVNMPSGQELFSTASIYADAPSADAEKQAETEVAKVEKQTETAQVEVNMLAKPFTIVLACKVPEENAKAFMDQLEKQGFTEAMLVDDGKMNMIVYSGYDSFNEANESLTSMKNQSSLFASGWILNR